MEIARNTTRKTIKVMDTNSKINHAAENLELENPFLLYGNEYKLAFETAIGDMDNDSSFEFMDSYLDHALD